MEHISVLLNEAIDILSPKKGESILDVTLGLGGHSEAFLNAVGSKGSLTALDADKQNLEDAEKRLSDIAGAKTFIHSNFSELGNLDLGTFDMIFADLGVSSPHFDDAERGFSFRLDGPLDLRFDRSTGITAAKWLQYSSQEEIANALFHFGEVKQSRKISDEIKKQNPQTTFELKKCVEDTCGFRANSLLPQVFQALRIVLNDELDALDELLRVGQTLLNPGGRMAVISFHSLEDRIVKQTFRALCADEKDDYTGAVSVEADFLALTKKPITPSDEEKEQNPRSRSAKMRAIERKG